MFEYVSIIHAIVWPFVPTSGAGMSYSGPMFSPSAWVKRRVMRCSSCRETECGSNLMPPLPPPKGRRMSGRLPRHHRRERLDVVERDLRVVAHPALERAEQVVVLDAVALEEPHFAAVHADGEVDDELVLRLAEDRLDVRLDLRDLRGAVEVVLDRPCRSRTPWPWTLATSREGLRTSWELMRPILPSRPDRSVRPRQRRETRAPRSRSGRPRGREHRRGRARSRPSP